MHWMKNSTKIHLKKWAGQTGVVRCFFDVLDAYLENRKLFVRLDNTSSKVLSTTSGVPQWSLVGLLLSWIFINCLPNIDLVSDPYLFADDFKLLASGNIQSDVQSEINAIHSRVWTNHMFLAIEEYSMPKIPGMKKVNPARKFEKTENETKILGKTVGKNFPQTAHKHDRLKKVNRVVYNIRNVTFLLKPFLGFGLYEAHLLSILLCGLNCLTLGKTDLQILEIFQTKLLKEKRESIKNARASSGSWKFFHS